MSSKVVKYNENHDIVENSSLVINSGVFFHACRKFFIKISQKVLN